MTQPYTTYRGNAAFLEKLREHGEEGGRQRLELPWPELRDAALHHLEHRGRHVAREQRPEGLEEHNRRQETPGIHHLPGVLQGNLPSRM